MLSRGVFAIGIVALALFAGCATVSRPADGQGSASPVGAGTPACATGLVHNRASGLCVGGGQ